MRVGMLDPAVTKCYGRVVGTAPLFLEGPGGRLSSLNELHGFPSPRKIHSTSEPFHVISNLSSPLTNYDCKNYNVILPLGAL